MADLKSVYLVCGDDDAKIDAWRVRLRHRAEEEKGPGGLETFDARMSEPDEVAAALASLTFDPGTRYLLVDGTEAWKAGQLGPLEHALEEGAPDTVLVLLVRGKPLKTLRDAVEKAGGDVADCAAPKPWELPRWAVERGRELGLQLEKEAAKELVARAGPSQQRLSRELEKLAIALHPAVNAGTEEVEELTAGEAAPQAYDLADALVAGDLRTTLAIAEELEAHGERAQRLVFPVVRRLREVHRAVVLIESGMPEQKVAGALGGPPWLAKKTIARARKADRATLEHAIEVFSELEVDLRGGGELQLDEDTAFSLALARATA
ncbi:MAG: DNA polymerase III subunit delta [Thermoleophilaceae bacterium]|nr:DNA polymerase III subunit delta [Thermoleophilaceae bacterium]